MHRHFDVKFAQNVQIIWLNGNIDVNNDDYDHSIIQLRCVARVVKTFADVDQCIDFLTEIDYERILLIISDQTSYSIIPFIHDVSQLDSIYILDKTNDHTQYQQQWSKIKGVFVEFSLLYKSLEANVYQCEQNAVSISFISMKTDITNPNIDQLDQYFMYTQILKEILLQINFEDKHIKRYADYCRKFSIGNDRQLDIINKFEREYHQKTPIWWYTYEGFVYSIINRALRIMDIDAILHISFFIHDLHLHIEKLHSEQFGGDTIAENFFVYRGQGLSNKDFDQLKKSKGGLISFNNFLSTTTDRDVSFAYAESNQNRPDTIGILFVMMIDPSVSSTPFACIDGISCYQTEQEILFSMHTIFRIRDLKQIDHNNQLWQVELVLTSDNDQELDAITKCIREETRGSMRWEELARFLMIIGRPEKAEEIYEAILEENSDKIMLGIFELIGVCKAKQHKYDEAIKYLKKSCEFNEKFLPKNHMYLAISYNNLSNVYSDIGEYSNALLFTKKSLDIWQTILPENHMNLSNLYNNMADVYRKIGDYSKAILFYEKAMKIKEENLPSSHPDLANIYHNLAVLFSEIGDYSKAFFFREKVLKIHERTLPSEHPDLAVSYTSMGDFYNNMGDCTKALLFHQKSLDITLKQQPQNYLNLASNYSNIGNVYENIGDYLQARHFHEKSAEIHKKYFLHKHYLLGNDYNNIALTYQKAGEYSKANDFFEKSMIIRKKYLPSNHLDLAASYNNIGLNYGYMGLYSKALSYHEKALEIRLDINPPNYRDLAFSYNNIGVVHSYLNNYSKALSFYEKALEIRQKFLPLNHPDFVSSYANIAHCYSDLGEYQKALSFYEKGLEVCQTLSSFPHHPDVVGLFNNISSVYNDMGDYHKAFSYIERAVQIGKVALPSNHPYLQMSLKHFDVIKNNLQSNH